MVVHMTNASEKKKFYMPNGMELEKEEFIKSYNDSYYLDNDRLVPGVSQNSRIVENEIDMLLKNGIKNEIDVIHILAWKIGKVKHNEIEKQKSYVYASDWIDAEKYQMKLYGKPLYVKDFVKYIVSNISDLEKQVKENPQDVLNKLKEKSPQGIGTVYLITVLYFISRGTLPIYDRFAMMAVDAIFDGKQPGEYVQYRELPYKNDKNFFQVIDYYKKTYISKIEKIFGDKYKNSRDIDRALWVYGHLFSGSKGQC